MSHGIQLATKEQIEQGEKIAAIFLPTSTKRKTERRAIRGRYAHYTSAAAALSIIRTKSLWLRNTTAMADFSEVQHGARAMGLHPELTSWISTLDQKIPGLGTTARNEFANRWNSIQYDTFLASLSEHRDTEDQLGRLSMWRGFARSNTRVALIFRVGEKPGSAQPLRTIMHPVEYFDSLELGAELKAISESVTQNKEFLLAQDQPTVKLYAFLSLVLNVICLKHPGFKEELEWRIIYLPSMIPSPIVQSSIETIDGIPQRIFKVPLDGAGVEGLEELQFPRLIDRVIIGPTQFARVLHDAFVHELEMAGIPNAGERVFISDIPIRT